MSLQKAPIDNSSRVMFNTPNGMICVPARDLDKIKIPSFIGTTQYTKTSYQQHRDAFFRTFPYEETIGKINPYTKERISSLADYELYCLSFYLKFSAEEELRELRSRCETLSRKNEEMKKSSELSQQEAKHFKKRAKALSVVFYVSLYLLFLSVSFILMLNEIVVVEWIAPLVFGPYCLFWVFTIVSDWKKGFRKKHKLEFYTSLLIVALSFFAAIISQFFV